MAAVDVADDVEGSVVGAPVGPRRLALDLGRLDLLGAAEDEDTAKPLAVEPPERALQLRELLTNHARAEVPIGPARVAFYAQPFRQVEHDRHGQDVMRPGELDEGPAGLPLDVRGVDDRDPSKTEPLAGDEVQGVERVLRDRLVVLVVGHQAAELVGGEHLCRLEMTGGERGLPRPRRSDEHDERELRDGDLHCVNTAIPVGGPTSGSSGPTGWNRTV